MLIIKFGGSVIQNSLTELNPKVFEFIRKILKLNTKVVITTGGGKVSRQYQNFLRENGISDEESLDEVGSQAVNLNAEYIKHMFPMSKTFPQVITSTELLHQAKKELDSYDFFICGAKQSRITSDFNAVQSAVEFKCSTILRISNTPYICNVDPNQKDNARPLFHLGWSEYLKLIGNPDKIVSGKSYPFDPIASRLARENNIKVYFTSLDKFLETENINLENFDGTVIS